jgi:5-methylcytosine-specific restriction endonuclease McrA
MYCDQHQSLRSANRLQRDKERGSAHHRGYNSTHRKWRSLVLHRDPLCRIKQICGGFAASTEADHIVPISKAGARFDLANGQGACKACHAHKTATEDSCFANRKR